MPNMTVNIPYIYRAYEYFRYKYLTIDDFEIFLKQWDAGAYIDANNNIIVDPTNIPDHQDGDTYAIGYTCDASAATITFAPLNVGQPVQMVRRPDIILNEGVKTVVGEFVGVIDSGSFYSDTNIVGRRIKFYTNDSAAGIVNWYAGRVISTGTFIKAGNNYYRATNAATTGSTIPTHTRGIQSDGAVNWEYMHSGTSTAIINSVSDEASMTAYAKNYLPVFVSTTGNVFDRYQWSLWGEHEIYPHDIFMMEDRLGFLTNTRFGSNISLSKSSDYFNFATEEFGEVSDNCALNIMIPSSTEQRPINKWILAKDKLLIGMESEEFVLTGNPYITPTSYKLSSNGNLGGKNVRPVSFGFNNFFVSYNGKRINNYKFNDTTKVYEQTKITKFIDNLLKTGIKKLIPYYADDNILLIQTEDNKVVCMSSNEDASVNGFSTLSLTNVVDLVAGRTDKDILYMCYKRNNQIFFDYVRQDNPSYVWSFKGRDVIYEDGVQIQYTHVDEPQYANQDVYVVVPLSETYYYAKVKLDGNGQYKFIQPCNQYWVGFPMMAQIDTHPFSNKTGMNTQQITGLKIRLLGSAGFDYKSSVHNDVLQSFKYFDATTIMRTGIKELTGDFDLPLPSGRGQSNPLITNDYPNSAGVGLHIESDLPADLNILSITEDYI